MTADSEAWAEELRDKRAEKDDFFAEHPQSPIPPDERESFSGLDYFEPDADYRVDATVEVHDRPEPVEMETTAGPPVRYLRVATFSFDLDGASGDDGESGDDGAETDDDASGDDGDASGDDGDDATNELHGYRQEGDDSRTVFLPFRDKTTGQQSYEGGRYMEIEPEEPLEDGGDVTIDFNLAYTPFCAYSETFSCPLPPEENWLDVVIEAGERAP